MIVPVPPVRDSPWFLDANNPATTELERVLAQPPSSPPAVDDPFRDLWTELLTDQRAELAKGSGTLAVTSGSADVTVNADSQWRLADPRDVRREVYIAGERYEIAPSRQARVKLDSGYHARRFRGGTSREHTVRPVERNSRLAMYWTTTSML